MSAALLDIVPLSPVGASPDFNDQNVLRLARRIFFRRFSRSVQAAGIDLDDAFQAVCIGLITRSRMPSRWNPERGALSNWMFVATTGVVRNLVDQQRRALRRNGSVGLGRDVAEELRWVEEARVDDAVARGEG